MFGLSILNLMLQSVKKFLILKNFYIFRYFQNKTNSSTDFISIKFLIIWIY